MPDMAMGNLKKQTYNRWHIWKCTVYTMIK